MNIGLMGAPGSGKSTLAKELATGLDGAVGIVDDYIAEIEQEANLAIGPISSYVGNFYVSLFRYGRERRSREDHAHTITCGTLVETAVHTSLQVEAMMKIITDDEKQMELARVEAILRMLSVLYLDIFTYDKLFYLPVKINAHPDSLLVDKYIQAAIEGFKLVDAVVLTEENRLKQAMEAIGELQAAE